MSYLSLILNNKADFIQELSRKRDKFIDIKTINWSQSRVVIIADSFNRYQKESINFKDLAIELWELKQFNDWIIVYNPIRATNSTESIKTVTKFETQEFEKVNKEIRTYSVNDHFKNLWDKSREIYEELRDRIMLLDSRIEETPIKLYIWYKIWTKVSAILFIKKSKISLELLRVEPKDLSDPEKRTYYKDNSMKYYNKHVTIFNINDIDDIDYAIMLTKQVLKKFF